MQELKIYLMGACKFVDKAFQNSWRNKIKQELENYDCRYKVKVINPNDYFNYYEEKHRTQKQIKDYYMWQIDTSQLCICNLDCTDMSVGTGMESEHSVMKNVPIIGFGSTNTYTWTELNCTVIFNNVDEAIEYVKEYYLD